jgi:GTP-binding protein Era
MIVLLTKLDVGSMDSIKSHREEIQKLVKPNSVLEISSLNNTNITNVIHEISKYLDSNDEVPIIEQDDNFIISEIIREQIIKITKQEIPYSVSIMIDQLKYEDKNNMFHINASIVVEKESQKPIIIGAKGQMIKQIGINARQELLKIYNCKINLQLFVKVKKD